MAAERVFFKYIGGRQGAREGNESKSRERELDASRPDLDHSVGTKVRRDFCKSNK